MHSPPVPIDEVARQAALDALKVLETGFEISFDQRALAAAEICQTPIALVSLVDRDRQWFKANIGLPDVVETPRELAFCAYAICEDEVFEVEDTLLDRRFVDHPLVVGDPKIRFYAGAPLRLANNQRVGTLCVIDRQPRQLTKLQRDALQSLAQSVARMLDARAATP